MGEDGGGEERRGKELATKCFYHVWYRCEGGMCGCGIRERGGCVAVGGAIAVGYCRHG